MLFWSLAANAGCTPTSAADFQSTISGAEAAFDALNLERFQAKEAEARTNFPCLEEALSPDTAAALHRIRAIRAFVDRDFVLTEAHFGSARLLAPDFEFQTLGDDHPLLLHYSTVDLAQHRPRALAEAHPEVQLWVDGQSGPTYREGLPHFVQVRDGELSSTLVQGDQPFPAYRTAPTSIEPTKPRSKKTGRRVALSAVAVGLGALAVATQPVGTARYKKLSTPSSDPVENDRKWKQVRSNQALFNGAGIGLGVGALAIGVSAFL